MKRTILLPPALITALFLFAAAVPLVFAQYRGVGNAPGKQIPASPVTGYLVNTLDDLADGTCGAGHCSLREAITVANANPGDDAITFSVSGTITLGGPLPAITGNLTMDGSGQNVTISAANLYRVLLVDSEAVLQLKDLTISKGHNEGGGVLNWGTLIVTGSTFSANKADGNGGGLFNTGMATVTNSTFTGNGAGYGGAVFNWGELDVSNSTFSDNAAKNDGGGIFNKDSTLTVTHSTFSENGAENNGAGIFNRGVLLVTHTTLSANQAKGSGGGIFNDKGQLDVTYSTLSGNAAGLLGSGGGIYSNEGRLNVINSTFSGNQTGAIGLGGGIYTYSRIAATVTNSTFSGNQASAGGAIRYVGSGAMLTLTNNVLALNPAPEPGHGNCSAGSGGNIADGGGNLSFDDTCPGYVSEPLELGPLADNGGSTQTFALLPGSPAIDAAVSEKCPATDQRGVARPQGADCDVGAYEYQTATTHLIFLPGLLAAE